MTDLFGHTQSAPTTPRAKRTALRLPHRCSACGRRTYRKRRLIPVRDDRCQRCFDRGYFPKATDPTKEPTP